MASKLFRHLSHDRQALLAEDGVTVPVTQLFDLLLEHPVVFMPVVRQLLKKTKPMAAKAIEVLQRAEILFEIGEQKRNQTYSYRPYLDLLQLRVAVG